MSSANFERLVDLMARLRGPQGCPWDREQTIESLRRYLIEETYEVIDAIDRKDWAHLPEELGDLQLQIVFQAQIASEAGHFNIDNVLESINGKLVRRHPHVFGEELAETAGQVLHRWEEIKAEEQRGKQAQSGDGSQSLLDGVPRSQPALLEAEQLGKKAAKAGFDWKDARGLIEKLKEEIGELEAALDGKEAAGIEQEIGDLLFMLVNVARHARVNPELALRQTNAKFRKRFTHVEEGLRRKGQAPESASLDEMEELWQQAKSL